jgi:hypothetical protein
LDKNLTEQDRNRAGKILNDISKAWNLQEYQRDLSNESMRFVDVAGAQWEGWIQRQFANRPRLEMDKTSLAVNKFNAEWRESRSTVRYRADDSDTSEKDAEVLNGLFRRDYRKGDGEQAIDHAVAEMSKGGVGGIRLRTDYEVPEDPDNNDQRVIFDHIFNAYNTLVWDPNAKKQNKADAKWAAIITEYTQEAFEEEFPGCAPESFFIPLDRSLFNLNEMRMVYVAEYYQCVYKREMIFKYINRNTGEKKKIFKSDLDEELIIQLADNGYDKIGERRIERKVVEKSILYGGGYLEKPHRISGNMIPIAPCYGYGSYVDGQQFFFGLVEKQKDAQRLLNMAISNMAENAATSPKSMPILTPEQVAGHEQRWAEQHLGKHAYTLLNSVDDQGMPIPLGPVQYVQPAQIDPNTTALLQATDEFIRSTTGGMPQDVLDPDASGKAINAAISQVDLQTGVLRDNIMQFVKTVGEIYLGIASEIYDHERFIRIVNMDGSDKTILLKQYVLHGKYDKFVRINDVSKMKLDVVVDTGPSFSTRRRETVDVLNQIIQNTDSGSPYFPLLYAGIIENVEGPGLDALKKFNKQQMILGGFAEPETEEEMAFYQQAMQQKSGAADAQQQALIANINSQTQLNQASAADKQIEAQKTMVEIEKLKSDIKQQDADTEAQKLENRLIESGIMKAMGGMPKAGAV